MLSDYLIAPSFTALFVTGLIMFIIVILLIKNYKSILRLGYYQKIMLLTSLSIAVGSHGLMHLGVEGQYNFNPYKWI
jgi:hypothetical protein